MIEVMCNGNYNALAKNGNDDPELLHDAWESIYCEFCDKSGGASIHSLISTTKATVALSSKIDRIYKTVDYLANSRSEELCSELKKDGYLLTWDADNDTYRRQILTIISRLKNEEMRLEQMIADRPKQKGNKKMTEDDFDSAIFEIGALQHRNAQRSDFTVMTYAIALKQLRKHIEGITPKTQKNGRRAA